MATTSRKLRFVDVAARLPDKRPPAERRRDFREIYAEYAEARAAEQAARCSQCGVPFCQIHCPLHNNIPDWLKLTAEGRLEEAYEVSQATNAFPEICGRICPQDRLCEGNCVIEKGFDSVTIGSVEKYITDTAFERGWVRAPKPARALDASVGIVGAGPAGLSAAEALRRRGYAVTVYDRYDRVGGLLIYGIPNFKLEKEIVQRRAALLAEGGVAFRLNFEIGRDASLAELRAKHDAVLIATGVYKAREIQCPGAGLGGIHAAMDFLTAANRKGLGDAVPGFDDGTLDARGRHVVVVGGGDTAMDCVRTAVRQGAKSVTCLYRRDKRNMPGSQREVFHAEEEGVRFEYLAAPEAFVGRSAARRKGPESVKAVRAVRMRLGVADATGRQTPEPVPGSGFELPADLVLKALGFDPEDVPGAFGAPELAVTRWGTLRIDWRTMQTALDGVFAAGDIVRGASLVVWAIRDGRDAAAAIHRFLARRTAIALPAAAD
jgi:glutamate synthase (NADPH/NADH) small chain